MSHTADAAEEAAKIRISPHWSYKGLSSTAKQMARAVAIMAKSWRKVHQVQAAAQEWLTSTYEVYLINTGLNHYLNPHSCCVNCFNDIGDRTATDLRLPIRDR